MRYWLSILLVLLIAGSLFAATPKTNGTTAAKVNGSDGKVCGQSASPSYLYHEDFESNASCTTLGITTSGTVTCQHSSAGLNMEGSYVFRADANGTAYHTFTSSSVVSAVLKWRVEDAIDSGSEIFMAVRDSSGNQLCRISMTYDGLLKASDATLNTGNSTSITYTDASVYFRIDYAAGSGANGQCSGAWWNGSSWSELSSPITTSAKTANAAQIFWNNWQDGAGVEYQYFDEIFVSTTKITADPTTL